MVGGTNIKVSKIALLFLCASLLPGFVKVEVDCSFAFINYKMFAFMSLYLLANCDTDIDNTMRIL